ncbi:MAG: hypothetical protein QW812_02150 [Thermoplasmataceae archaeon]
MPENEKQTESDTFSIEIKLHVPAAYRKVFLETLNVAEKTATDLLKLAGVGTKQGAETVKKLRKINIK